MATEKPTKQEYKLLKFVFSLILALVSPLITLDVATMAMSGKSYFGLMSVPQLIYQAFVHSDFGIASIYFLALIPSLIVYTLIFFFIINKINPDFSKKKNLFFMVAIILIIAILAFPVSAYVNQKYALAIEQNKCTDKDYSQLGDLKLTIGSAPQFGATEDICLLAFADADNDLSFCNSIQNTKFKQFCLNMMENPRGSRELNFPKEFCLDYTNQEMKDKCYYALATRLTPTLQEALNTCTEVSTISFKGNYTRRDDCYAAIDRIKSTLK